TELDDVPHGRKLMEDARSLVAHLEPKLEVVPLVGYADEVILDAIGNAPVDLFLMGPFHDRGPGSLTAIGPTAQRVVQYAPVTTLMHKGNRAAIRRILVCVAVDDTIVVDVAIKFASAVGAELSLLHI